MPTVTSQNNQLFRYLSAGFLGASVIYLVYEIAWFEGYPELIIALKESSRKHFIWLIAVVALLPLNWLIEALKWKKVCRYHEKFKLSTAFKAVLAGTSSGFVTPNRIGDIIGRMNFIHEENRKRAISLAAINSLTQNLAILLPGIPLAILFFLQQQTDIKSATYILFLIVIMLLLICTLIVLPQIAKRVKNQKLQPYFSGHANYTINDMAVITGWSLLRFFVFSLQLFLMLRFFGIELTATQALTSIPVTYLLVTFTPSFAFSEAAIRGSWAVFVIGSFATNTPGILMAGVGLWFINVILPVIAGNILLLKLRLGKASASSKFPELTN
jgi:cytochrome c-type biogenesis protein CcmH/NrfF